MGGCVRGITLLFLGGVSEVEDALPPRREALVTLVGPLASLAIGAVLLLFGPHLGFLPVDVRLSIRLLGVLNFVLGLFNLIPAFPLDGGRLLRALLSVRLGRLRATRVAVTVGKVLAVGLAALTLRSGDVTLLIVGAFIFFGAHREGSAVERDEASGGLRVVDATTGVRLTLPAWTRASEALRQFRTARADTAVVIDALDRPVGLIGAAALAAAPEGMVIADLPGAQAGVVCRDVPLFEALARLRAAAVRALPVIGPGAVLVGVVVRDDIERVLDGAAADALASAAPLYLPRSSS
jgi:CBS domain-containing protein